MHCLDDNVALVIGRDSPDPDLTKPWPHSVRAAVGILDTEGARCVLVGDAASDILAGLLAGVPVIGYAPNPAEVRELADSGARVLAASMDDIRTAMRALPPAMRSDR